MNADKASRRLRAELEGDLILSLSALLEELLPQEWTHSLTEDEIEKIFIEGLMATTRKIKRDNLVARAVKSFRADQ